MSEGLWIDDLRRKHEFGPSFGEPFPLEVIHEGVRYTILTPDILPDPERLQIRSTVRSDQFFVMIAQHTLADKANPYERGILLVAKCVGERTYAVHVWHELFAPTLGLLGLDQPTPPYGKWGNSDADDEQQAD